MARHIPPPLAGVGMGRRVGGKQVLRGLQVLMVQQPPPGVGGGGPNRPGGGAGRRAGVLGGMQNKRPHRAEGAAE